MLGETVANSLSSNKTYSSGVGVSGSSGTGRKGSGTPDSPGCRPGVVTVVDVQSVVDPQVTKSTCSSFTTAIERKLTLM